jgi:hypothetical protein
MKYCPYCGTVLVDGAVSFCMECGKELPVSEKKEQIPEKSNQSEQQGKSEREIQHEKKSSRRQKREPLYEEKGKERKMDRASEKIELLEPPKRPKQQPESSAVTSSIPKDDYDGYYDDILPADEGRFSEGIDRGLVKKIVLIIVMVLLIVGACVMMMYLL